ncbi:unnamed protein product [marine sediment metagenome]|uniref:Uncharacterized protein n=1 Tax=marine sediment metagenome TaxID=412755 RepID=X0X7Q5_9ZZZZ
MSDKILGITPAGAMAEIEETNGKSHNWTSTKFFGMVGGSLAMMSFASVGLAMDWLTEFNYMTMQWTGLITISAYCGVNLAEKLGGIKGIIGKIGEKIAKVK